MPINGLVVMTPTSIASTGTGNSSSINADGSVDFASCETLSLNGVFTSSYENYMIVLRGTCSDNRNIWTRFRVSGTDASGTDYTQQYIYASSTSVSGSRGTFNFFSTSVAWGSTQSGNIIYIFGPKLAQPTVARSVDMSGDSINYARIYDVAVTHSLSTAYDGISFLPNGATMTGLVSVFGFNQ